MVAELPEAMQMLIGLIGGVASGKSTVARQLQSLGALWLDSDRMAHDVLESSEVIPELQRLFGADVFDPAAGVNRKQIASQVFGDDPQSTQRRRELEALIHPRVRQLTNARIAEAADRYPAIVIDAPLLVEAGLVSQCQRVLLIDTPLELRQRLAAARGWSTAELARREASQLSIEAKRAHATDVIINDGSVELLQQRVTQFWQRRVMPK